jgi:hypothetical protein
LGGSGERSGEGSGREQGGDGKYGDGVRRIYQLGDRATAKAEAASSEVHVSATVEDCPLIDG